MFLRLRVLGLFFQTAPANAAQSIKFAIRSYSLSRWHCCRDFEDCCLTKQCSRLIPAPLSLVVKTLMTLTSHLNLLKNRYTCASQCVSHWYCSAPLEGAWAWCHLRVYGCSQQDHRGAIPVAPAPVLPLVHWGHSMGGDVAIAVGLQRVEMGTMKPKNCARPAPSPHSFQAVRHFKGRRVGGVCFEALCGRNLIPPPPAHTPTPRRVCSWPRREANDLSLVQTYPFRSVFTWCRECLCQGIQKPLLWQWAYSKLC